MEKMIKVDVIELEFLKKNQYINDGVKTVLVNPEMIAELWPVETVKISKRTNIMNDRFIVSGTLKVARMYTVNRHQVSSNGDTALKFITPESYEKLVNNLAGLSVPFKD